MHGTWPHEDRSECVVAAGSEPEATGLRNVALPKVQGRLFGVVREFTDRPGSALRRHDLSMAPLPCPQAADEPERIAGADPTTNPVASRSPPGTEQ